MTLSDVLNNTATAVIGAPIAVEIADRLGANPDPFLMAVAVAASCAFLTPIGHKNNTLILGPGGYAFGDYWRMGLPLEVDRRRWWRCRRSCWSGRSSIRPASGSPTTFGAGAGRTVVEHRRPPGTVARLGAETADRRALRRRLRRDRSAPGLRLRAARRGLTRQRQALGAAVGTGAATGGRGRVDAVADAAGRAGAGALAELAADSAEPARQQTALLHWLRSAPRAARFAAALAAAACCACGCLLAPAGRAPPRPDTAASSARLLLGERHRDRRPAPGRPGTRPTASKFAVAGVPR